MSRPDASPAQRPAVFLDRDGTVMRDVDYCSDPAHVEIFAGAAAALARLKAHGFALIMITNQSGIGRGYFDEAQFEAVQAEVNRQLGDGLLDASYHSPDAPDADSARRKPSPAMIFEAARAHRLDLSRSFFIGDKAIDVQCGRNAGVRTILVETGYGTAQKNECVPDAIAADLRAAADFILAHSDA